MKFISMFSILQLCSAQKVLDFFGNGIKDDSKIRFAILENSPGWCQNIIFYM